LARRTARWRITTPSDRAGVFVVAATAPLSDPVAQLIMPIRPVLYESGHITVYYRMDQHSRLLMRSRGPMRLIRGPSDISYLIRYAERLWPQLKGVSWTHGRNSRLAITADHYPHVRETAENLLLSLGCNGCGVALSTAMGGQLARLLIGGKSAAIDMPIIGIKPIALHASWPVAVTATVLAGRARDRLGI
jgi:glycine/D-amino acid oxidase-like deaminating enzyme